MPVNLNPIARALENGLKAGLRVGMYDVYLKAREETRDLLRGQMFNRQTGATERNVMRNSGMGRDGLSFHLKTTKPGLIAWMKGSRRKGYWVLPINFKYLRWKDKKTGEYRYSTGHQIRPWRFAPKRPLFETALQRLKAKEANDSFDKAVKRSLRKTSFRGGKMTVRLEL